MLLTKAVACKISEWQISYETHWQIDLQTPVIYHLLVQQNRQSRSTPNDHNKVVKIKVMLQTIRCLKHYLTLSDDIYTRLCDSPHDHKDVVYHREYTLQKPGVMCAEVARIMGRTILSEDIQVSPPNHPVALLNWWSLTLMLAEQLATNRKLCCIRAASTGGPGAHCAWRSLSSTPAPTQGDHRSRRGVDQSLFRIDPVRAWEETFRGWKGGGNGPPTGRSRQLGDPPRMAAANHEWCHCGTPHHCGQNNAHRECMGPVIGNGLQRRLLCDWGVWARLHRAPPLSPRPATPVSKANCHTTGIKEATSHLRGGKGHCWSRIPTVSRKYIYTVTLVTWPVTTTGLGCSQIQCLDSLWRRHRCRNMCS